jgi:hypothetical protein
MVGGGNDIECRCQDCARQEVPKMAPIAALSSSDFRQPAYVWFRLGCSGSRTSHAPGVATGITDRINGSATASCAP